MKKLRVTVFATALVIGLVFASGCGFSGFSKTKGVRGSGAAKSERRAVSGFSKIEIDGAVNLTIRTQNDFDVSIEADDNLLQYIKTEVDGETLKIHSEGSISPKFGINVKILMPEIKGLDVSGASSAVITNVKTESLDLKASGASKIKIDGAAKDLRSEASGASRIDAENLSVENAEAEASGASSSIISAANDLNLDASGASNIVYTGEPKNIKQNSSGASSIKKK